MPDLQGSLLNATEDGSSSSSITLDIGSYLYLTGPDEQCLVVVTFDESRSDSLNVVATDPNRTYIQGIGPVTHHNPFIIEAVVKAMMKRLQFFDTSKIEEPVNVVWHFKSAPDKLNLPDRIGLIATNVPFGSLGASFWSHVLEYADAGLERVSILPAAKGKESI